MKYKLLHGFTISETLIAVGIIGVISVLTIPNVVKNYQRNANLVGLKKVYTELQNNLTVFQTENYRNRSLYASRLASGTNDVKSFFTDYYKINKDCGAVSQPCFAASYDSIDGTSVAFACANGHSVLLANGTAVCMVPASPATKTPKEDDPTQFDETPAAPATVFVDINGTNAPNIGGRDMFTFNIYGDYSIDVVEPDKIKNGTAKGSRDTLFADNCLASATGLGCFGKILNDDWKMNY